MSELEQHMINKIADAYQEPVHFGHAMCMEQVLEQVMRGCGPVVRKMDGSRLPSDEIMARAIVRWLMCDRATAPGDNRVAEAVLDEVLAIADSNDMREAK